MQTTLLSLAIAVILALLAALLGPYFVDWNAHRATFEQQASQLTGLPVKVRGPMDVRLLPSPTLLLSGIEIGKPGDPQALRAKALGIEFALPPLLSGKLRAVEMKVIGPELRLSLDRDGRAQVPAALAGMNIEALAIEKLSIDDARIELADAASGTRAVLDKAWFNGEVRALPGPFRGEGAFVMDGALYGYRVSSARPEPGGARIKLTLDPSDPAVLAEVDGLLSADSGAPRFEGHATVARRGGKADKGAVPEPWKVTARVKATPAAALFEQVEFQYGPDDRALKLNGTAEAKFGAQPQLDVVLSARQLDADKVLAGADGTSPRPRAAIAALVSAAAGSVKLPLPAQVGFGIDSILLGGANLQNLRGDLEFGRDGVTLSGFELRAPGFTTIQASGQIDLRAQPGFAGPVDVTSVDPRALAEWLDGKDNAVQMPARPLRLRGDVTAGPGRFAIARMQAEFDRKSFDGAMSYRAKAEGLPSRLDAQLRAEDLDLDALLQIAGSPQVWSGTERPEEVALSLELDRLRLAGLDGAKADLKVALNADAFAVERFRVADVAGVAIDGKGILDLKTTRGSIDFELGLRDASALKSAAARLSPRWSERLAQSADALVPARLKGAVTLAPGKENDTRRAVIVLSGPLGPVQLDLKSSVSGQWSRPLASDLSVQATLDAADVNALLKLSTADSWVRAPRQPGTYTLTLNGRPDGDVAIDTRIAAANVDLRAAGTLHAWPTDARKAALDLSVGQAEIMLPLPQSGSRAAIPVSFKSRVSYEAGLARFEKIAAKVDGTTIQGRLAIGSDTPATIDGDLTADSIDAGALLAAMSGAQPDASKIWSEAVFSASPLPPMTGTVAVKAARAAISPSVQAANARATLRFNGTAIAAEGVEADALGGRVTADVTLSRAAEGVGLKGQIAIANADARQWLTGQSIAASGGRISMRVQLEGAGLSPKALVGSLNGNGTLSLEQVQVAALDPKAFAVATRSVDQGLPLDATRIRDVVTRALEAGPLTVRNAETALSIAAGVVRIESFTARADSADLSATGSYNLSEASVDARLAMIGPASPGTILRPELGIHLRGPSSAPQRSLDVSALTGWLAMRSVDRQTRRIEAIEQGRPVEQAIPESDTSATSSLPDVSPIIPRRRPQPQAVQPPAVQPAAPRPQSGLEPLPPPIEIGPAPGERRRAPQRVESPQQRPAQANPFPKPIAPLNPQRTF